MNREKTVFKIKDHEQLERWNYLLCFKSKSAIAEILIDTEQENKELHNKIDKAIKYIEENTQELEGITGYYYTIYDTEDLLKILKGSDVDECK